jgi:hypothetical protein
VKALKEIGLKYNTDKAKHVITRDGMTYLDVYETYFQNMRYEKINFLELGVLNGSSLRTWREYFPNANIHGMDIDPATARFASPSENIQVDIISQTDNEKLERYVYGKSFDIIIDDASHINRFTINSFNILFKALKEGGFYVIEDLGNSYIDLNTHNLKQNWPGMRYNQEEDFENRIEEIHEFTNRIVEEIDQLSSLNLSFGRYTYLHRYKWVMVIKK